MMDLDYLLIIYHLNLNPPTCEIQGRVDGHGGGPFDVPLGKTCGFRGGFVFCDDPMSMCCKEECCVHNRKWCDRQWFGEKINVNLIGVLI